jgi:dUTP pyrophosphatase
MDNLDNIHTLHILCDEKVYSEYYTSPKNHLDDSGFDLFCPEDLIIHPKSFSTRIDLKIKCRLENTLGISIPWKIYPRSSMGSKSPLRLSNSVAIIDSMYRGNVMILVDNLSDVPWKISKGDRLVQCVAFDGKSIRSKYTCSIDSTERGEGGFGSTGK